MCDFLSFRYVFKFVFYSLGFAFTTAPSSAADLDNIKLRVVYGNDYAERYDRYAGGYDEKHHRYKSSYVDSVIKKPVARSVIATVCKSLEQRKIRLTSPKHDGKRCKSRTERFAPGASSFVYTLRGKHPLLNKQAVLQTIRKELHPGSRKPDENGCVALYTTTASVVPNDACEIEFDIPIQGEAALGPAPSYSITFEALDGKGKLVQERTKTFGVPKIVPLIVSVGDSYASGEGNPDRRGKSKDDNYNPIGQRDCEDDTTVMYATGLKPVMLKQPKWLDADYHRSLRSAPALAVRELLQEWPYINFLPFAKSGAHVNSPKNKFDVLEQLNQAADLLGDYRIDVLMITVGGNDVGFAKVLASLTKFSSIEEMRAKFDDGIKNLTEFDDNKKNITPSGYAGIPYTIRKRKLNVGAIVINEYPGGIFNNRQGKPDRGCGLFRNLRFIRISQKEAKAISEMEAILNEQIRRTAKHYGWHFVTGITTKFRRHGYCTGAQSYYRSAEDSCDMQGDFEGVMHPNESGTAVYAAALAGELRKLLPPPDVLLPER